MRKKINYLLSDKKIYVGLEDSKRTWKLCVRSDNLEIVNVSFPAEFNNLTSYFNNKFPNCDITVIYEAGFSGFNLYDKLTSEGIKCIVTPPHTVTEQKCNRVKTDKIDARRLSKVLEHNDYGQCFVPDKERRSDRQLSRTLVSIKKHIVSLRNQIRKFCDFQGVAPELKPGAWSQKEYNHVARLDTGISALNKCISAMFSSLTALLNSEKELREELKTLTQKDRYKKSFEIICSTPGIGWFTAIRLVLEWGEDLSRFHNGKQFASFLGLTMSEYSTGDTQRKGRITGQSPCFVRRWLIQCAWLAYKKDPVLLDKFRRVWSNSGSKKKAIVAVARKMMVRLRGLILRGESYCIGVIE